MNRGDDAFGAAMTAAYPHFKKCVEVPPEAENVHEEEDKALKPVERDVIHIKTEKCQRLQHTSFPYKLILNQVAFVSGLTIAEILSPRRQKHIVRWRQISMYLMCKYTNASMQVIGRRMGGRDHSTVVHARNKLERHMDEYRDDIEKVESFL